LGSDGSGQEDATPDTGRGEEARQRHPVVVAVLAVVYVTLAAGAVVFVALLVLVAAMRSGPPEPPDGPDLVNATDRIVTVDSGMLLSDGSYHWGRIAKLEPGERRPWYIGCPGSRPVRAFGPDGELVAEGELVADAACSGEWVIEADG
jgi:hypothetical protein